MSNFLNELKISHFKSIKEVEIDCKRVNVFIGKPNVGKSNILEAIALLGAHYSKNHDKFLSEFIRYEEISNLFYDDNLLNDVNVVSDKVLARLRYHTSNVNQADLITGGNNEYTRMLLDLNTATTGAIYMKYSELLSKFEQAGIWDIEPFYTAIGETGRCGRGLADILSTTLNPIKKYEFKQAESFSNKFPNYLLPPYGDNLFSIVDYNQDLRKEIVDMFAEYGLQFVASKKYSKFEIQKSIDGYVYKYHYTSIADTFQRLIFYFAAIDSNKDSVLILEEPEVHSFPPYTKELADRIIASTSNQFFITTHSPYLLQNLISNLGNEELNVFITYFENYETKIKKLSVEELRKVSDFHMDLFFNLDQFVQNG